MERELLFGLTVSDLDLICVTEPYLFAEWFWINFSCTNFNPLTCAIENVYFYLSGSRSVTVTR